MRALFIIFCCFNAVSAQSQSFSTDTFSLKRSEFISNYWAELNMTDTILNSKDSLIVHFKNKQGYIRQKVEIKNDTGCVRNSFTNYIDDKGFLRYCEKWHFSCQYTEPDDYDGLLHTYIRYIYNDKGTLIREFKNFNSSGTWRDDYLYAENGDRYSKSVQIRRNEFWNE